MLTYFDFKRREKEKIGNWETADGGQDGADSSRT